MNFAFILNTGCPEGAPATWVATVRADIGAEDRVERHILSRLPTVSALRVRGALGTVEGLFQQVTHALHGMTGLVLAVGILVLVAAITAGHRERVREAVILKILGATRRTILKIWVLEYGMTGLSTGLLAAVVGWSLRRLCDNGYEAAVVFHAGARARSGSGLPCSGRELGSWEQLVPAVSSFRPCLAPQ